MVKHPFSNEQLKQLRQSPYITVSEKHQIMYTDSFKSEFSRMIHEGMKAESIFKELGVDPALIGSKRIESFRYRMKKYEQSKEDLTKPEAKQNLPQTDRQKIKDLEHELELTKQELAFLKKKRSIDRFYQG